MQFHLRDLFWLLLVGALAMSHITVLLQRNECVMCPCCSSMYDLDLWRYTLETPE
ncbi:MAG: hypothetical protein ACYS7Y_11885 [Planctomycetota bacterium]|jgi:hypothetical protein